MKVSYNKYVQKLYIYRVGLEILSENHDSQKKKRLTGS